MKLYFLALVIVHSFLNLFHLKKLYWFLTLKSILFFAFLLTGFFNISQKSYAQVNDNYHWTWMKGGNGSGAHLCVYGQQGVPNPNNTPGSRGNSFSWQDTAGNFYLFGGSGQASGGSSNSLNDLWKYSVTTNEWTFLKGDTAANLAGRYGKKGVANATNNPGGRYGTQSWRDSLGNLWLLGGFGRDANGASGALGDLWKYNLTNNEWSWMGGDTVVNLNSVYGQMGVPNNTNHPGARYISAFWTDEDKCFWLYGGTGRAMNAQNQSREGQLGDLWKYNPYTNQWTWMKGDTLIAQDARRGTLGIANADNTPGSRSSGSSWFNNGMLYFYGGVNASSNRMADMWRFDPSTNNWTWMSGNNMPSVVSVQGVRNVSSPTNTPGSRMQNPAAWTDNFGNMYLFGGQGQNGQHSDLWRYNALNNEWTWIKGGIAGSNTGALGNYGIKGVANSNNFPGKRELCPAGGWIFKNELWLFGGRSQSSGIGDFNDLWRLGYNCKLGGGNIKDVITIDTIVCGTQFRFQDQILNESGKHIIKTYVDCDTTIYNIDLTLDHPNAIINVDSSKLSTTETYQTYQWLLDGDMIPNAKQDIFTVIENGNYQVIVSTKNGCMDTSEIYKVTNATNIREVRGFDILIYPNPSSEVVFINSPIPLHIRIYSLEGKVIKSFWNKSELNINDLTNGIYFMQLLKKNGELLKVEKLIKQ